MSLRVEATRMASAKAAAWAADAARTADADEAADDARANAYEIMFDWLIEEMQS
jgi:hypothetical protein